MKNINFIFSWLKNFLYVGNFFLSPEFSNTYIKKTNEDFEIYSRMKNKLSDDLINMKKKINNFFRKFYFYKVPFINFSKFINGSDAHYTSTIFNIKINNRKILKRIVK